MKLFRHSLLVISHSLRHWSFVISVLCVLCASVVMPALAQADPVTVTWTTQSHFENNGAEILPDPGFSPFTPLESFRQ
jgi:hypothetical protein